MIIAFTVFLYLLGAFVVFVLGVVIFEMRPDYLLWTPLNALIVALWFVAVPLAIILGTIRKNLRQ